MKRRNNRRLWRSSLEIVCSRSKRRWKRRSRMSPIMPWRLKNLGSSRRIFLWLQRIQVTMKALIKFGHLDYMMKRCDTRHMVPCLRSIKVIKWMRRLCLKGLLMERRREWWWKGVSRRKLLYGDHFNVSNDWEAM